MALAMTTAFTEDDALRYHKTQLLPSHIEQSNAIAFLKYVRCFCLSEAGDLHYMNKLDKSVRDLRMVVFSEHRKKLIFSYFHNGSGEKHLSYQDTVEVITTHFYWRDVAHDIEKRFRHCPICKNSSNALSSSKTINAANHRSSNNEPSEIGTFMKFLKLQPNSSTMQSKQRLSVPDHDYVADRLTVKRMLCRSDPVECPPAKRRHLHNTRWPEMAGFAGKSQDVSPFATRRATNIHVAEKAAVRIQSQKVSSNLLTSLTIPRSTFPVLPDSECRQFLSLLGLEQVVDYLGNEGEVVERATVTTHSCAVCEGTFTPIWHKGRQGIICDACHRPKRSVPRRIKRTVKITPRNHSVHLQPIKMVPNRAARSIIPLRPASTLPHHLKSTGTSNVALTSASSAPLATAGRHKQVRIFYKQSKPMQVVVPKVNYVPSVWRPVAHANASKMTLMEAANKLRDHINGQLKVIRKRATNELDDIKTRTVRYIGNTKVTKIAPKQTQPPPKKKPTSLELIQCMQRAATARIEKKST